MNLLQRPICTATNAECVLTLQRPVADLMYLSLVKLWYAQCFRYTCGSLLKYFLHYFILKIFMFLHRGMWATLTSHAELDKSLPWSKYLSFGDCGNGKLWSANWKEERGTEYMEKKSSIKFKLSLLVIHLLYLFVL